MKKREDYKRFFFLSIIIISLGVVFSTTLKDNVGSLGTIFIAIGGLLFIVAMSKKRKVEEQKKEE